MEMIVTPYLKLSNNKELLLIICAFEEKHRLIWTYITLVFHSLYLNLNKDGATNLFSIWRYKSGMHLYRPSVFLRMKNPVFRMAFLYCYSCFHLSSKQKLCWSKELQECFSNFSQASPEGIQGTWKAKVEEPFVSYPLNLPGSQDHQRSLRSKQDPHLSLSLWRENSLFLVDIWRSFKSFIWGL